MSNPKDIVKEIQNRIDNFQSGIPAIEKKAFNEIQLLIRDLKLSATGDIKVSVENLRLINKIKSKLSGIILDEKYLSKVGDLTKSFDAVTGLQTGYFNNVFTDFEKPKVIDELKKVSIRSTTESLSASEIEANIVSKVGTILEENIKNGASFADMNSQLQEFILGSNDAPSKLASYSKQVLTDSLSQYSANYQKIITDDLGLKWFQYVGPEVKATRPLCHALVEKRWIHESEIPSICRGVVDGENVGKDGMIAGTNASNFQVYRGGWNCGHLLVPVSAESVPVEIRRRFEPRDD